jgi:hypothetical protein
MRKNRISIHLVTAALILILVLDFIPASAQQEIRIDEVVPNQASPGQEVRLELRGEGFDNLEELTAVNLSGVELEVLDYEHLSNERIEVTVYIPPETPPGQTEIRFIFEQIALDAFFIVTAPGSPGGPAAVYQIDPLEGELDTEIELSIMGERLQDLGGLSHIFIAEVDVPYWDYRFESDQSAAVQVYLPEELPAGRTIISLHYGNYVFEDRFTVTGPTSTGGGFATLFIIFIGVVVVAGVAVVVRIAKGRKTPQKELEERAEKPQATIDFKVEVDPGTQSVEPARPSHAMSLDLRFEVEADPGVQSIEANENPLIDEDATRLSR